MTQAVSLGGLWVWSNSGSVSIDILEMALQTLQGQCTLGLLATDKQKVRKLLSGLNPSYYTCITSTGVLHIGIEG